MSIHCDDEVVWWLASRWPGRADEVMSDIRGIAAEIPTGHDARFADYVLDGDLAVLRPVTPFRLVARGETTLVRVELDAIGDTLISVAETRSGRRVERVVPLLSGRAPFSVAEPAIAVLPEPEMADDVARLAEWVQLMSEWRTMELDGAVASGLERVLPSGAIRVSEVARSFECRLRRRDEVRPFGMYRFYIEEAVVDNPLGDLTGLVSWTIQLPDEAR